MGKQFYRVMWTIGLVGVSAAALAGEAPKKAPPQEPIGFVSGAVVGAFAAGPIGAVVGAGVGTWLGNRVHRAGEAKLAEAQVAKLTGEGDKLREQNSSLLVRQAALSASNEDLSAKLDDMSKKVQTAQRVSEDASQALDGLQGDVFFRTGSAEISTDLAHQIQVLAQALTKAPELKVRIDGYADPRGTDEENLKLSQARADAVRDLLLSAGVNADSLEVNAYGKSQSTAQDSDGYAMERRVRMTLKMDEGQSVASNGGSH
jgi:outer membrane protein OmpA-like peptidoglycan-associated protein